MNKDLSKMSKAELLEYAVRLKDEQREESVALNTRLPRYLRDDLRNAATDQDTTLQSVVQQACQEWIDHQDQQKHL